MLVLISYENDTIKLLLQSIQVHHPIKVKCYFLPIICVFINCMQMVFNKKGREGVKYYFKLFMLENISDASNYRCLGLGFHQLQKRLATDLDKLKDQKMHHQ